MEPERPNRNAVREQQESKKKTVSCMSDAELRGIKKAAEEKKRRRRRRRRKLKGRVLAVGRVEGESFFHRRPPSSFSPRPSLPSFPLFLFLALSTVRWAIGGQRRKSAIFYCVSRHGNRATPWTREKKENETPRESPDAAKQNGRKW